MKHVLAALMIAVAAVATAAEKYGAVDMTVLLRHHKNYDSNKQLLADTEKEYKEKLDQLRSEGEKVQAKGKKIYDEASNPMLAPAAKQKFEEELRKVQEELMGIDQRIRAEMLRSQQDLQALEARLLKATMKDLNEQVAKFAKENGYDLIFDASAVPYIKSEHDVTPGVLKTMGVDPAQLKAEDEGK